MRCAVDLVDQSQFEKVTADGREFMAELRTIHLGEPAPERDGPSVIERLANAYTAVL